MIVLGSFAVEKRMPEPIFSLRADEGLDVRIQLVPTLISTMINAVKIMADKLIKNPASLALTSPTQFVFPLAGLSAPSPPKSVMTAEPTATKVVITPRRIVQPPSTRLKICPRTQ